MNLKGRIRKIEQEATPKTPCFCGEITFIKVFHSGIDELTFCRRCKPTYDKWQELFQTGANQGEEVNLATAPITE